MVQTIVQAKENIWVEINEDMTEILPSIEIISEQEDLVKRSKEVIEGIKESLGQNPREATALIRILNSNTKEELEEFEIANRTETILEVRRVLTKRNLILQLEKKCHNLEADIQKFPRKFNALNQKRFPGLKGIGYKLIKLDYY